MQLLTARRISTRIAILISTLSACAQGRSVVPPSPQSEPVIPKASAENKSWVPQIAAGIYRYIIEDSSIISINDDTITKSVPITSTMIYSLSIDRSRDSIVLMGKVDSAIIDSRIPRRNPFANIAKDKEFHAILSIRGQLISAAKDSSSACSSSSSPTISPIYELILPVRQEELKIGDKWMDTVSSTSCHGRTPLIQQVIRTFEVKQFTTHDNQSTVEIVRNSSITFAGTTTDPGSQLSARGSGTAITTMIFDQSTATLLESNSQIESALTVITSRGKFPFTQHTISHIISKELPH